MKQRDNCTGSGKHAHPIDRAMPKATGIPRSAYKKPRKPSTGRMFNRAWPPLTPPSPLIRHHSALDLVYLVYLVCLVNRTNQITGQSRQSSAIPSHLLTFHLSRLTFHVPGKADDFSGGKRYPLPRTCAAQQESNPAGCSKRPSSKAAASEEARRTLRYVEPLSEARTMLAGFFSILLKVSAGTRKGLHEFNNRHDRITSIQDAPLVRTVGVYL